MEYVKTNWQTGDVITAAKLNNMETGIYDATEAAADAFVAEIDDPQDGDVIKYDGTAEKWVNAADDNEFVITCTITSQDFSGTIDKTPEQITAAYNEGKNIKVSLPSMGATAIPNAFVDVDGTIQLTWLMTYRAQSLEYYLLRGTTSLTESTYSVAMFNLTVSGS